VLSRSSPTQAAAAGTATTAAPAVAPTLTTEDVCMSDEVAATPNARPVHS
jgi:hypothetical protein